MTLCVFVSVCIALNGLGWLVMEKSTINSVVRLL